jgi:hypothetical protein
MKAHRLIAVLSKSVLLLLVLLAPTRVLAATERISVDSSGAQGNNASSAPAISSDGRYVAFQSLASNLVSADTNGQLDVFVHDRQTGQTTMVSIDSNGVQGNNASSAPAISSDGRYVAFQSLASNLVSADTNGQLDVFVHDRQTGQTTMVSVDSNGVQGNNASSAPAISSDGRYVAFQSLASNLVSADTNGQLDVFVRDRQTGQTTMVSIDSNGAQGNNASSASAISSDGRYVAFQSLASNLVSDDTDGVGDVFRHDRQTGQTTMASVDSSGNQGNNASDEPSISADGRYVAFHSSATDLVTGDTNGVGDVFVYDSQSGTPAISRDPSSLSASCAQGTNASSQTFHVANLDGGSLRYSIAVDADWLSCSPSSGISNGEQETITVTYATSGLAKGAYSATISIAATEASNTPQTIPVTLTVDGESTGETVGGQDWSCFINTMKGAPHKVQSSPSPELSTMLLLGAGLVGLAGVGRRFKK